MNGANKIINNSQGYKIHLLITKMDLTLMILKIDGKLIISIALLLNAKRQIFSVSFFLILRSSGL